jgi:CheY-like chemotaxis protein
MLGKSKYVTKKVILLVEDLPFDTEFTLRALEKFEGKFDILVAQDGWDALVLMKHQKFDLILLDLKMPRMDGFETLVWMKTYQLQKNVPLLILSNSDIDSDCDKGRELGAAGYIHKSNDLNQFKMALQSVIELHSYI